MNYQYFDIVLMIEGYMFGKEIKQIRIEHGVTQTQISEATGIPQNTISWIESDKGIPNISMQITRRLLRYYH